MIVREYSNQQPVIEQLRHELDTMLNNFEFVVDDNINQQNRIDLLVERVNVLERLQLMQQRQADRLRRKNQILRNRIDVLESTQKRRRVGEILDRTLEYDSTVDNSSESEVEIIEVSDTDEVDV